MNYAELQMMIDEKVTEYLTTRNPEAWKEAQRLRDELEKLKEKEIND